MPNGYALKIAENAGASTGSDFAWPGSSGGGAKTAFIAEATWGGGNIKLQLKTANGTYIDVPSGSITANNILFLDLPPGTYRHVITTSSAVHAWLVRI